MLTCHQFQYSQMVRYSKAVTSHWRSEQRKRRILESSFSKERKDWRQQEADIKDRIAALEKAEAKLKKWEQRREMINHYLGLVGKMGEYVASRHLITTPLTAPGTSIECAHSWLRSACTYQMDTTLSRRAKATPTMNINNTHTHRVKFVETALLRLVRWPGHIERPER